METVDLDGRAAAVITYDRCDSNVVGNDMISI